MTPLLMMAFAALAAFAVVPSVLPTDPPAEDPPVTDPPAEDPPVTDPPAPTTLEEALALVAKERGQRQAANREAQTHRAKLRELETKEEERRQAGLTETQKEKERADRAEAQLVEAKNQVVAGRVTTAAAKLKFADPEDVTKFIDLSQVNETGSNIDELVKQLSTDKPYLLAKPRGSGGGAEKDPPNDLDTTTEANKIKRASGLFSSIGRRVEN